MSKLYVELIKKEMYIKQTDVNTGGNEKIKSKLTSKYIKCSSTYLGSPLYRGSSLWDKLEKNVQELPSTKQFANVFVYKGLLN